MIKTIKKIDLQNNETWQEVLVCNRCKKTLEPTDFVYETEWTAYHPVKMRPGFAWGFGKGANPTKHLCVDCQAEVEAFINGTEAEHGRWIPQLAIEQTIRGVHSCHTEYRCSICNGVELKNSNHCPNCDAKMDLEE